MRSCALPIVLVAATAHADGSYYEQSFGISTARSDARAVLGHSLHVRFGIGFKVEALTIEPWLAGDLAMSRDNAMYGVFGGTPQMGHADLQGIGIDAKYTCALGEGAAIYVRGGPRIATGDGSLAMYAGRGIGAGAGVQLTGKVRAIGLLWAPLFFLQRGPKVTGAVFLDEGVDAYWLTAPSAPAISAPIVSTNLGFAVGTDF